MKQLEKKLAISKLTNLYNNIELNDASEDKAEKLDALFKVVSNYGIETISLDELIKNNIPNKYMFFYLEASTPQDNYFYAKFKGDNVVKHFKGCEATLNNYIDRMSKLTGENYEMKRPSYYQAHKGSNIIRELKSDPSKLYLRYEKINSYMEAKYTCDSKGFIDFKDIENFYRKRSTSPIMQYRSIKLDNINVLHINGIKIDLTN